MQKSYTAPTERDNELVARAQDGCDASLNELVAAYERVVRRMSSRFFLPGADREDIVQEGMVGLAFAIRSFDLKFERRFYDYALMCVRNSLIRAIRTATRKKHQVLSQASDLSDAAWVSSTEQTDEVVLQRLSLRQLWQGLRGRLSGLEMEVLRLRMDDQNAEDIADRFGISVKQVENALFRARQKAKAVMSRQRRAGLQAA